MTLSIQLSNSDYRALCDGATLLGRSPTQHAEKLIVANLRNHTQRKAKFPKSEAEFLASTRNQPAKQSSLVESFKKANLKQTQNK